MEKIKETMDAIEGEMVSILGDLTVAQTWLCDGWDGTLEPVTNVIPVLERTVTAAKEAVERTLRLAQEFQNG
jgi:hypothetical protein